MKSMKSTVQRIDEDELLKILGEKSPVGVCIIQDGKFCYLNSNFPLAIGYTVDELMDKDPVELIVPEDREMVRESAVKMLNGELLAPYQFRVIHKDGSIRWVMAREVSVQYHRRRAVLGNYMEVTERKQMEEVLKESEERYRELANSITDVFFAMDEDLRYTYWNEASEVLTGIRAEDAIGKSLREIFPDTPRIRNAEKVYRNVLKTQHPQTFVANFNGNGRHYIFEISAYPSRGGISVFVKDITEHKQAEEALRQSEERYRTILEEMGDGYFETDLAGNLTFVNDAMIRLLGYSKQEIIGMNFRAFTPEGKVKTVFEAYNRVFKTGEPLINFPTEVIRKDGGHIFAETSAFPTRSDRGEIIGFRGIRRDITARKQMEEALRQSEETYRTILQQMEDSYFEVDLGGHLTFVNNSVCRDLGYSREELTGMSYKDFTAEDDIESLFRVFNEVYRTGVPNKGFPWKTIRKDGSHGFAETSISLLKNSKGEISGFRGVGRDITERRQMEEALRESEKRLRLISENSSDVICLHDPDHRYVYVSPACKQVLGYEPEELIGTNPWELVHPDDLEALRKEGQEKALQGMPVLLSYRIRKKSGEYVWFESVSQSLKDDVGKVLGFVTSSRDITERKKTEEALRQSKEKYRALFDSAVIGTLVVDAETMKVVIGNQAAVKMFGFDSAEEGFGVNLLDFVPQKEREKALELLRRELYEQDSRRAFDLQTVTKDGREIWISATGARITHGGRLAGLLSFVDVTERKQAEEALRQSEERYRTILQEMEDSYFEVDLGGHLTFVNDSVCRDLGYSKEELIGMSYRDFVAEDDIQSVFRVFNEVYQIGVPNKGFPWKTIRKDGTQGFAETSISLLRNDRGEIIGFRGVGRDITERRQAEERLRQSEENYKTLFNSSVIGMYVLDVETMKIAMGNQAAREMAGFSSPEQGIGINPFDFVHPEDKEQVVEIAAKEFEQDLRRTHEVRVMGKDGRIGWISITAARIMHDGRLAALVSFTDITERKKMEEALQSEKNKLQSIIDAMQDDLTIQDTEYDIVFQNEPARITSGGDHAGEKCYWAYEGNESTCEDCPVEKSFKDGKPHISERQRVLPSGELSFWETISNPIRDASGKIVACLEIGRNITERKRQEQALADELTRRRLLIDQSLDGIVVLDIDARVVEANQRFAEMLGYTLKEVRDLHTWDWDKSYPPEKILEMGRNADEKGFHLETKHTRKDGCIIDVDISINAAMCAGRKLIFCVSRDVTTRNKMAEALKLAAEEWSRTFDSISDAVSIHDKDFRILRANKAFADLFRKSLNEIIGIHCYELHKGQKPRSECPHQHTLTTGKPAAAEFYESHLGKYLLESTSPILNEQGEVVGTVHITRDITGQKRQSERLMMTERLASVGELAAGTAHELNNPLTSIIGFSQLLMEKEVPDDIREDLKLINNEAQRAANVTRNLLTFARKQAPVKQRSQINNIIEDVLKLRAYEHKANSIEVERQLGPDLPEIMADYFQMQQVFLNIIINAEYFMVKAHSKGVLTITTKKQNDAVVISFADDGLGIPPENLRRIFDPFFTTKEAGKGTGLGLSICHGIVTEHGGQIYAMNQPDKGAIIVVELPINGG